SADRPARVTQEARHKRFHGARSFRSDKKGRSRAASKGHQERRRKTLRFGTRVKNRSGKDRRDRRAFPGDGEKDRRDREIGETDSRPRKRIETRSPRQRGAPANGVDASSAIESKDRLRACSSVG